MNLQGLTNHLRDALSKFVSTVEKDLCVKVTDREWEEGCNSNNKDGNRCGKVKAKGKSACTTHSKVSTKLDTSKLEKPGDYPTLQAVRKNSFGNYTLEIEGVTFVCSKLTKNFHGVEGENGTVIDLTDDQRKLLISRRLPIDSKSDVADPNEVKIG